MEYIYITARGIVYALADKKVNKAIVKMELEECL